MIQILSTDGVEVIFQVCTHDSDNHLQEYQKLEVVFKANYWFSSENSQRPTLLFKFVCILLKKYRIWTNAIQINLIRIIQNRAKIIDIKNSRTYQGVVLRILQTDCLNRRVSLKDSGVVKKLFLVVVFCTLMRQRSSLCVGLLKTYLVENNIRIHLGCNR